MEKHVPKIVGSWLAGTYDRDRAVARAAKDGITSFLDTEEKVTVFWKLCQPQILEYAQEAINETPQSLSDERTMSADDIQAKYFRVIGSSISLVVNLLIKLSNDDILKYQDKYEEFLANNKKLWSLVASEDAFVRKTVDQLLIVCLEKQSPIIETDQELISHAFIAEGLRTSQLTSALQLLQALRNLTSKFPHAWTLSYKGKKAPLSRLRTFVEKGSQGGPAEYWGSLRSLLQILPAGVLPSDVDASLDFLMGLRAGISSREEPRNNATEAWSNYFEITKLVVSNLTEPAGRGKVFQESVYPVFEQYLHPTTENSRWSVGSSTAVLAKAYKICASDKDTEVLQSFSDEWQRLADDFVARLLTSLPEQSKDYHKSQASVVAEGHRWFGLLAEIRRLSGESSSNDLLASPSNKIIITAIKAMVNRNGKPYAAAATVEAALRLTSTIIENPSILEPVRSFLQDHLPKLIVSPSWQYLVSILNLFRSLPGQGAVFEDVWQSTVDGLLPLPEDTNKSKIMAALIANDAVAKLSQADPALQDFLFDAAVRAMDGNPDIWPLFEAAVTFDSLTETTALKILNQVFVYLDLNGSDLDGALKALELISKKRPGLLRHDNTIHVVLITKLLGLTEIADSLLASRAVSLRSVIENSNNASVEDGQRQTPILHVIKESLEIASSQSLA